MLSVEPPAGRWLPRLRPEVAPVVLMAVDGEQSGPHLDVVTDLASAVGARVAVTQLGGEGRRFGPGVSRAVIDELRDRDLEAFAVAGPSIRDDRLLLLWAAHESQAEAVALASGERGRLGNSRVRTLARDLVAGGWPVLKVPHVLPLGWRPGRLLSRIVVAVGSDPRVRHVAAWPARLARPSAGQIVAVHVLDRPRRFMRGPGALPDRAPGGSPGRDRAGWRDGVEPASLAVCARRLRAAGVLARFEVRRGSVVDEIAAAARDTAAGLVVVGAGRRSRRAPWLCSSAWERISSEVSIPVLIVP